MKRLAAIAYTVAACIIAARDVDIYTAIFCLASLAVVAPIIYRDLLEV
jgi:hypothetical protein